MRTAILALSLMGSSALAAQPGARVTYIPFGEALLSARIHAMGGCMSDDDCNDGYRCVGQVMGPPCDFSNPQPGCNQYGPGFCSP